MNAPFPWFGGKSTVADVVWQRFGNVDNYVEPFFGSGAVLLSRPVEHFQHPAIRVETVNDLDGFLCNFWRAIKHDPMTTAEHACWPVSEKDLHARHRWLVNEGAERLQKLNLSDNPDAFDAQVAGWWVWGLCCWIGSGWCQTLKRQLPHLGNAGQGVTKTLPKPSDDPRVMVSGLREWFGELSLRLARVRIASGDWRRVSGHSVTTKHGMTGMFLDPPYSGKEHDIRYAADTDPASEVLEWCKANGNNPLLRIALCGYAGEHDELVGLGWQVHEWKARGGMSARGSRAEANASRERIWFSPYCEQRGLFD